METSGGIQASLAGRYASALFDLARDATAARRGRAAASTRCGQALADSTDFARADRPARWSAATRPARRSPRSRRSSTLDPITDELPRRARRERPHGRAARRHPRVPARSPPTIAARPPPKSPPPIRSNDDQVAALKAAAPHPRRPRRHGRRQRRSRHPRRPRRQARQPDDRRLDPHQTQPSRARDERLSRHGYPRR